MKNLAVFHIYMALSITLGVSSSSLHAQDSPPLSVSGTVSSADGPMSGVNIIIKNTSSGVITDFDGHYTIDAKPNDTLLFSYLGYTTVTIPIKNRSVINVTLQEDATALGEVRINAGYYTTTDREKTGSIARITAKEIEGQPVNNALDALQGRVNGLDIVQTTGLPGGGYTVRIRGQNSISAGNDPLFVIDGLPYDIGSMTNQSISGLVLPRGNINPLNSLDPRSIATIEVLKDADATAIYGSRGANGVILITTKKGKAGKTILSLDVTNTMISVTNRLDLLNTSQYLAVRREAFANDGMTDYPSNAYDVNGTWNPKRYTDWQEVFLGNTAYNHMTRAAITGGSERTNISLGGSFMKETTVFPTDFNYKRTTAYTTFSHRSENDKFHLQFSANYGLDSNFLPTTDLSGKAKTLAPNAPALYDPEGKLNWENSTWDNPYADLESTYNNQTNNLVANTALGYGITKNMELKLSLGYSQSQLNETQRNPHTRYNPACGLTSSASNLYKNYAKRNSYSIEPQLNASYPVADGVLSMSAGATFQEKNMEEFAIYAYGFQTNSLITLVSAAQNSRILNERNTKYRYNAIYARINYNYNKKYILNLTGRRDGSSRFGSGQKFANFGAIGAAWIISEEALFKNKDWLSHLKLRASLGSTGNDQIGDYQYLETYSLTNGGYDGNIGLVPSRLFNPLYAWEKNLKKEIAIEASLIKGNIRIELAHYRNTSDNQLVGIPLPGTTGFASINANLDATVSNTGWELDLNATLLQQKDLKWEAGFLLTVPKNKLTAFSGLENSTYVNQLVIGEPLDISKRYNLLGVNPQTGLFEFEDYNGDGVITSSGDRQYISDLSPKLYGSLSNTVSFKNWNLDVLFQFMKKDGFNELSGTDYPGRFKQHTTSVLDHWQTPGNIAPMQMYTAGGNSEAVTAYSRFKLSNGVISDASFLRLKSVSLSYRLPLRNTDNFDCTIYAQGQNLWTWTALKSGDPEQISGFLPPVRRIALGIKMLL